MTRTVGVEEEFLLVRSGSGELAEQGGEIVATAEDADEHGQYEQELKRAQVELGSRPTTDLSQLRADLAGLRTQLMSAAQVAGARLVASGTNPRLQPAHVTSKQRYREMTEEFGLVARQALTCGMHVHVGVDSSAQRIAVLDGLAPWLAVLTALSANSPFYAGQDTGLASYRAVLWGTWPTAGLAAPFRDEATYRRVSAQLVALGVARDEGMLYFDARLSVRYPTVELRVCDVTPSVDDAVTIAALARALVEHLVVAATPRVEHRPELLRAASWRAARVGMTGDLVDLSGPVPQLRPAWELVERLVDLVLPALEDTGDADRVRSGLGSLRERGTGAEVQRAAYAERGEFGDVLAAASVRSE